MKVSTLFKKTYHNYFTFFKYFFIQDELLLQEYLYFKDCNLCYVSSNTALPVFLRSNLTLKYFTWDKDQTVAESSIKDTANK